MNSNTILTLSDELLERYRSSIPRKAFERFVEDITTGPAATAAPKFDASLLCRASFPASPSASGWSMARRTRSTPTPTTAA